MSAPRRLHRTPGAIFGWPAAIGMLSAVGLVSALVGDGIWDGISWAALLPPIVLCAVFIARGRRR